MASHGLRRSIAALLGAALLGDVNVTAVLAQDAGRGRAIYERWCAECHGVAGGGDGPAADHMLPRPRDFTRARYQIRTTANGELPTDADLRRVLELGMPGSAMPAWPNLTRAERADVIAYIKTFSRFFEGAAPQPMEFGADPGGGHEALEVGAEVYRRLECWKCHGDAGRGDGQSAPTLEDWRGLPIRAADLSEPWAFNGGMSAEEIHKRLLSGLDGTPMPAYSEALEAEIVTADDLWRLAHYVHSLSPGGAPETGELITASRMEDGLPGGLDDVAWERVRPSYVPLVGQVIEAPRQFAPTVDGVWVRAAHDGKELALLLEWNDPSRSPDPAWDEWRARILKALPADGSGPERASTSDGLALQFPPDIPEGMERPYFLMGDASNEVYLWYWGGEKGVSETKARGLGRLEPLAGGATSGAAAWEQGRWRLTMRRSLTPGTAEGLAFETGAAIPLAFYAWDGSSAEDVTRGSISGWYFIYLEEPRSASVYMVPLLAGIATGVLGVVAAARARRRRRPVAEAAAQPG